MNEAQAKVMAVLADLGGWSCHASLMRHGASTSSAKGLAARRVIEERYCESAKGFQFSEWRLPKVTDQEIIDFLNENIAGSDEEDFIKVARFADRTAIPDNAGGKPRACESD